MRLFEILLEARYESLYNKYKDKIITRASQDHSMKWKIPNDLLFKIKYLENNFNKYTEWVLLKWLQGNFLYEDLSRVKIAIDKFEEVKRGLDKKDINQYRTLNDLEDAVGLLNDIKSARQIKQEIKDEGIKKIYEDGNYLLAQLLTEQAACFYGSNTKWCTAARSSDNRFNEYNNIGPLYIIIDKQENRKYQISYATYQVMDETDSEVEYQKLKDKYPALSKAEPSAKEIYDKNPSMGITHLLRHISHFRNDRPWPDAEPYIIKEPYKAYEYAKYVIKDRWPEAERSISSKPYSAYEYAKYVIKDRWPEAEETMRSWPYVWADYLEFLESEGLINN